MIYRIMVMAGHIFGYKLYVCVYICIYNIYIFMYVFMSNAEMRKLMLIYYVEINERVGLDTFTLPFHTRLFCCLYFYEKKTKCMFQIKTSITQWVHISIDVSVPGALLTWGTHGTRMHCGKKAVRCFGWCSVGEPRVLPSMWMLLWHVPPTSAVLQTMNTLSWKLPDGCGLFQQHNVPQSTNGSGWFDELNNEFEVLTRTPNSPDLNPTEHLWDVMDKQVRSIKATQC